MMSEKYLFGSRCFLFLFIVFELRIVFSLFILIRSCVIYVLVVGDVILNKVSFCFLGFYVFWGEGYGNKLVIIM